MAHADITGKTLSKSPLSGLFATLADRFSKHLQYKRTVRELSELDTRSLDDLGISRAQIGSIAYESIYLRG